MNKENFEISKISYTNKDFPSIYPEIISIAESLTNKWKPSQSNESDPGIVLLKEGAFIADHLNYNIDKNILENFLPSATQDISVRNICEMNGYVPRYYVAATGEVRIRFKTDEAIETDDIGVTIPKFTLALSTDDDSITYTQLTDLVLTGDDNKDLVGTCLFIQGTLQNLSINNSGIITLDNLDDNNRIYLPETTVAQNGIFINSIDGSRDEWKRNNYILSKPAGTKVYKVDYNSSVGLPYIEFPSDIASLIGNGLSIRYISTMGEAGNVNASALVNIISPSTYTSIDSIGNSIIWATSNMTPSNAYSFINGKDPETINQMYKSFMKTVGTFETLVTCLDYSNYIYNLEDDAGQPIISNVVVTDRRTDYNKALNVATRDINGVYYENISLYPASLNFRGIVTSLPINSVVGDLFLLLTGVDGGTYSGDLYINDVMGFKKCNNLNLNDFVCLTQAMTPYDLSIYALKAFSMADYNPYIQYKALENSFKPVENPTLMDIKGYIEESKNICHTYKDPLSNEVFMFKNYAPLKINIIPYNKVTKTERNDIINNICIALSKNYNPRNVEFGEELEIDQLKTTIINADSRIKDISLDFDYYMKAMLTTGEEYTLDSDMITGANSTFLVDLIAKNVLAGRVCLFDFDNNFKYEFGQSWGALYRGVTSISSEVPIKIDTDQTNIAGKNHYKYLTMKEIDLKSGIFRYYLYNPTGDLTYRNPYFLESTSKGNMELCIQELDEDNNVINTWKFSAYGNIFYQIFVGNTIQQEEFLEVSTVKNFIFFPEGTSKITIQKIENYDNNFSQSSKINLDEYVLKGNEIVQIIHPNYYSTESYGTYVAYRYAISNEPGGGVAPTIPANTEYTLTSPIVFYYTEDGVTQTVEYGVGDVVRASFDVVDTNTISNYVVKEYNGANLRFSTLGSNQTIDKREIMTTIVDNTNLLCYWIIESSSDGSNTLFEEGEDEKILGDNDYFIYGNESLSSIVILGAGTKLVKSKNDPRDWTIDSNNYTIESVSENGLASDIPWKKLDFNKYNLYVTEMTIINLSEGDTLSIMGWEFANDEINTDNPVYINNTWKPCTAEITAIVNGETIVLPKTPKYYFIRSRLDISMSSEYPQTLYVSRTNGNITSRQTLTIYDSSGYHKITADNTYTLQIQCSEPISLIGGEDIDLSIYEANGISLDLYTYLSDRLHNCVGWDEPITPDRYLKSNIISIPSDGVLDAHFFPFWYENNKQEIYPHITRAYVIPVYVENEKLSVKVGVMAASRHSESDHDAYFYELEELGGNMVASNTPGEYILTGSKMYYIIPKRDKIDKNPIPTGNKYFCVWKTKRFRDVNPACVIVYDPVVITGVNSKLSTTLDSMPYNNPVLQRINDLTKGSDTPKIVPHFTNIPDSSMAIDLDRYMYVNAITGEYDMLAFDNPLIMFDNNNVARDITMAEVDIANSVIDINRSMRGY